MSEQRLLKITIINWDKYQSGRSGKHYPWLKLYARMIENPVIDTMSPPQFKVWIYLLVISNRLGSSTIEVSLEYIQRTTRVHRQSVLTSLDLLKQNQMVTIQNTPLYKNRIEENRIETTTTITKGPKKVVPKPKGNGHAPAISRSHFVWESYRTAYFEKYRVNPKRNAKVNGQVSQIISRLGESDAVEVVRFYVSHSDRWYVRQGHSLGLCLKDCEKLFMEWQSGKKVTSVTAAKVESLDHNMTVVSNYLKKNEQLELEREVNEKPAIASSRVLKAPCDTGRDM